MRTTTVSDLAARVLAASPRCGRTRLVCVDGPSGSGKTELAGRLAAALDDAPVLHLDEIYPGWDGLADAVPLLHELVVSPLAAGLPARYRRYDWVRHAFADPVYDLGVPPVLVVEGVGSGAAAVSAHAVLLAWIEAPAGERHRRCMARDGEGYRPHWRRWARQERAYFAAERVRERADVRIDGHPPLPAGPDGPLALLA